MSSKVESSNGAHRVTLGRLPGPYINRAPKLSGQKVEPAAGSACRYLHLLRRTRIEGGSHGRHGQPPPRRTIRCSRSTSGQCWRRSCGGHTVMTPRREAAAEMPEDGAEVYEYRAQGLLTPMPRA